MIGSSPLARGLLLRATAGRLGFRIIPARAGFTVPVLVDGGFCEDHPRSRGVYLAESAGARVAEGSSPLARGLHHSRAVPEVHEGIIPARAGFTFSGTISFGESTDHPRSRGVYSTCARVAMMHAGSSPLARGLPRNKIWTNPLAGIIPARAGFTTPRT